MPAVRPLFCAHLAGPLPGAALHSHRWEAGSSGPQCGGSAVCVVVRHTRSILRGLRACALKVLPPPHPPALQNTVHAALCLVRRGWRSARVRHAVCTLCSPRASLPRSRLHPGRPPLRTDVLQGAAQDEAKAAELTWPLRVRMALDASLGLLYLHRHSPPIIHRDVKSPNLASVGGLCLPPGHPAQDALPLLPAGMTASLTSLTASAVWLPPALVQLIDEHMRVKVADLNLRCGAAQSS